MADKPELTKEYIRCKVTTEARWTERAILALYSMQTDDERTDKETHHENSIGFNGFDAPLLSDYAVWIQAGHHLSARQLEVAQRRIGKYAGQLLLIAKTKP